MAYKSKYRVSNPSKYAGDPKKIIVFLSLWERNFGQWLENNPDVLLWDYESLKIRYFSVADNRWRTYYPDFIFRYRKPDGSLKTYLVEIKPYKQTQEPKKGKRKTKRFLQESYTWSVNCSKWRAAREYCEQNGLKFEIWTEHSLRSIGLKIL